MSNDYTTFLSIQPDQTGHEKFKEIPVINQQQIKSGVFDRENKSKTWSQCLKTALINFIWIYVVGIIAFYITMLSVSAQGSFLRQHFTISMVLILIISVVCSCLLTISMIRCRQTCEKLVPPLEDDEDEENFDAKKTFQDDKELLVDVDQRNIRQSFSSNHRIPSFYEIAAAR